MNTNTENNVIDNAIVEVKASTELVTIDPAKYAAAAFEPYKKDLASAKRAASKAGQFDITTTAGMKTAKDLRASFRAVRTGIENARKEAKAPVIEAGKKIDEVAREMTADVLPHEDKYDQAIKAEEARKEAEKQAAIAAERARIENIEAQLAHLRGIPQQFVLSDSITIAQQIESLVSLRLNPELYEEFLEQAVTAQNTAIDQLKQHHAAALAREDEARRVAAERAELARMKAAEVERQAKEEEARRQQAEAAAAVQRQQDQMQEIMSIQGMAAALEAAGQHQYRHHVEAALVKVRAFEPGEFGQMSGMAKLARDAALGLLEDLHAALPPEQIVVDQPVGAVSPVISDTVDIELDHTGVVVGQAQIVGEPIGFVVVQAPKKTIPPTKRPSDMDITEVLAKHFDAPAADVLKWIASFDIGAVREQLEAM